jgi:ankyrin repeat protein
MAERNFVLFSAHVAAANNAVRCMEILLPKLNKVSIADRVGRTCLHLAAYFGHYEMVELLIVTGGVDVNQVCLNVNFPNVEKYSQGQVRLG